MATSSSSPMERRLRSPAGPTYCAFSGLHPPRHLWGCCRYPKAARKAIKDADAARSDYLRRFYGVETELPTHYDLVVNTDILSVEQAAEVIAQGAS